MIEIGDIVQQEYSNTTIIGLVVDITSLYVKVRIIKATPTYVTMHPVHTSGEIFYMRIESKILSDIKILSKGS